MPIAIAINGSPTRLCKTDTPTSVGSVYTAPSAARVAILDILLANTTAASINASVYLNGTTSASAILGTVPVAANSTIQLTCFQVLNANEQIYALASAAGLTLTISGMQGL